MEVYRITNKTQIKSATHILLLTALFIVGVIYVIAFSVPDRAIYLYVFSGFYFFQILFWSLIHHNYYKTNKNDELTFDSNSPNEFCFTNENELIRFSKKDINGIFVYKSPALHRKNIRLFAWDDYNHVKIVLNNGRVIQLTSLLFGGEITIPVDESKIKTKLNFIRFVFNKSLV